MLVNVTDIINTVDGMVLEASERKVDVDGKVVQLRHHLGNVETRMSVVDVMVGDHIALGAAYQRLFRPHSDNRAD